ncbi:MAG: hypothetical protein SPI30_06810 [Prevotella sp.]|nr:hypothetical protein [Prevotella sp.]
MRKITIIMMAVLFCTTAFAQVTVPDEAVREDFAFSYKKSSFVTAIQTIQLATHGTDAYLNIEGKDVWVKGTWDGKSAAFPSAQPLGTNANKYLMAATFVATDIVSGGQSQTSYKYTAIDSLVLTFNETGDSLKSADNVAIVISEAQNVSPLNIVNWYVQPALIKMPDVPAIPADPTVTECDEYSETWGYGLIDFMMPVHDVNGNLLNIKKLYYNFYFDNDDEPFVFSKEDYKKIEEDMVNVPYEFDENDDFNVMITGVHAVAFYVADYSRIGIQSVYFGGGVENRSNIVWHVTTGIKPETADSKVGETYYDLTGKKVNNPEKGIYIKQDINANGSKKSVKVIK